MDDHRLVDDHRVVHDHDARAGRRRGIDVVNHDPMLDRHGDVVRLCRGGDSPADDASGDAASQSASEAVVEAARLGGGRQRKTGEGGSSNQNHFHFSETPCHCGGPIPCRASYMSQVCGRRLLSLAKTLLVRANRRRDGERQRVASRRGGLDRP
jgi:hypothetical protein